MAYLLESIPYVRRVELVDATKSPIKSSKETKMALSIRAKNFIMGSSLGAFAFGVFAYTVQQMSKDDFAELDEVAKVNVHQSGAIKATPVKKSE